MKTKPTQWRRRIARLCAIPTTTILLVALCNAPAGAKCKGAIDSFGTIIDKPGNYHLTTDLDSGGADGPAIAIVADHVHLDLNGHSIVGNGAVSTHTNLGIWIFGTPEDPRSHVHVKDGAVSDFHYAVWMDYTTKSQVTNMTVSANRGGIGLHASSNNKIKGNSSNQNAVAGILLQVGSSSNHISKNDCKKNGYQGIFLNASGGACDDNRIFGNDCSGNGLVGIWLNHSSSGNTIHKNRVLENNALGVAPNGGIVLGYPYVPSWLPTDNIITSNQVLGNATGDPLSFDVFDNHVYQSGACANLWRGNAFDVDCELDADSGADAGCMQ